MSTTRPQVVASFAATQALADPALAARATELLGDEERKTLARLRPATARRDYLAAHALARTILAHCTGQPPSHIRLRSTALGQPVVTAPRAARQLSVSLSHADGMALCAVSIGCVVGVDVESINNIGPRPMDAARVICSRRELNALKLLRGPARALRLLSIWTIKEAIAKATGLGFHLPLVRIAVRVDRGGALGVGFDDQAIATQGVRLASARLSPSHVATIAVLGAPGALTIRIGNVDWMLSRESPESEAPAQAPRLLAV